MHRKPLSGVAPVLFFNPEPESRKGPKGITPRKLDLCTWKRREVLAESAIWENGHDTEALKASNDFSVDLPR